MRTLKLTLAYDGSNYAGWQVQPDKRTVQQALEQALAQITGSEIRVVASGRTDAGVHAFAQAVSFRTDSHLAADVFMRALNAELPRDIAVLSAADVPDGFHAIRDAIRKRYRYVLHDGAVRDVFARDYCWHYSCRLDAPAMHRAAQRLKGKHDFRSFETDYPNQATSVRTIHDISVVRGTENREDFIDVEVEADGFLYNMVRAIVGTLVDVGRGAQDEEWPARVVAAQDRSQAGMTAPPQGLFLVKVDYE